jgi:hypothetical protein
VQLPLEPGVISPTRRPDCVALKALAMHGGIP